jgi:RNAse (barnase) inhibitor barstar
VEPDQRGRAVPVPRQIEVFFKQIKQTLQLADFLGNNANAINWQLWRRC